MDFYYNYYCRCDLRSQHEPDITNLFKNLRLFFPRHLWALALQEGLIGQCLQIGNIGTANYPPKRGAETNKSLFQLKYPIDKWATREMNAH